MKYLIKVSEHFYSIQGEGSTAGKPSVFLRQQACNLMCGGQATVKDKELHDGATWRCDTIETWLKGHSYITTQVVNGLFTRYAEAFLNGAQLVITGGEPLLQQDQIPALVSGLKDKLKKDIRVEIETNGTIKPLMEPSASAYVDQFNISPKLSNSGMPVDRRINPDALKYLTWFAQSGHAIFKFVVTQNKPDLDEILYDYVTAYKIPHDKIWLMPGCSTREEYEKNAPTVAELCKKYGFNFSGRLQINLWNQTTGV